MTSGYAIATLVVFIVSIFFVIHPVSIPTPQHFPRIRINLTTAPIFAIALLWAAQCIDSTVIRNGIVGTEGVKPYNILILFCSLAYMAITLDITGVLQAAAFWVSNQGGHSGWKLYFYFYVMLTLLSILMGNDPVVLSGTAFLVYYTDVAQLAPRPWVMAEFAAANTASMVLFVGNPTNVVICEGFNVNNAAFTAYTILPFLACNLFGFVALAFQFRKQVPRVLTRVERQNPRSALLDPVGACVGSFMLGTTLILCLVVSFFGIDVWKITLPFAVAKFVFDLGWDYYRYSHSIPMLGRGLPNSVEGLHQGSVVEKHPRRDDSLSHHTPFIDVERSERPTVEEGINQGSTVEKHPRRDDSPSRHNPSIDVEQPERPSSTFESNKAILAELQSTSPKIESRSDSGFQLVASTKDMKTHFIFRWWQSWQSWQSYMDGLHDRLDKRFPTLITALPRLPFALVPFAFSQFILIEALNHQGWVNVFANWLVTASHKQMYPTIWLIGVLGVILCNIAGTNIGATILLTKVVRAAALPHDADRAAAIALAIASNIGAISFTFSASLAGLLWEAILRQKKVRVKQTEFAFWNMLPILVMTTVGLGIVSAEMAVLF